jgi:hypothetical protein
MDSRSGAGPLLPIIWIDLIDVASLRFARVLEANGAMERGLGIDVNYAEIDSFLSGTACQPNERLVGHMLVSGGHENRHQAV